MANRIAGALSETKKVVGLLFRFRGRIQRPYFWVTFLVVEGVAGMLYFTIQFFSQFHGMGEFNPDIKQFEPTGPLLIALSVVGLVNLWINFALSVKRLHDRDRTGWWLTCPVIVVAIGLGLAILMQSYGQWSRTVAVSTIIATGGLMFWLFFEIGFLNGTKGPNRYGPDPLGTPGQTPA
jgi:uncharacterized membrane protein YhaH (DUF805 family)